MPDGQAALEYALKHPPALVVTDVMMPRLDGRGLLAALRSNPLTSLIPVIFLSAQAGAEAKAEALEQGADDYLVKVSKTRFLERQPLIPLSFYTAFPSERIDGKSERAFTTRKDEKGIRTKS